MPWIPWAATGDFGNYRLGGYDVPLCHRATPPSKRMTATVEMLASRSFVKLQGQSGAAIDANEEDCESVRTQKSELDIADLELQHQSSRTSGGAIHQEHTPPR